MAESREELMEVRKQMLPSVTAFSSRDSLSERGRPSAEKKEKDFLRQELARVRATAMEGNVDRRES